MVKQMEVDPRKPARRWKLQTARARLSEVYRRARTEGPQLITSDDNEGVIVLSAERYGWLVSRAHKPRSLVQFFATRHSWEWIWISIAAQMPRAI